MATIDELVEGNELVQLGGGLADHELPQGWLYAFPKVIRWLDETLPTLEPILDEGRQSPLEQVDDLFHEFVSGDDLSYYARSHSMRPSERGVWELKTPDVRFFGWFSKRRRFIIAEASSAEFCKVHDLYAGYLGSVVRLREGLGLDEPKFVMGDYQDVL